MKNQVSSLKNGLKVYDIVSKAFILDTNEYYLIEFKQFKKTDTVFLKDFILIEFSNTISKTIVEKPNKKSKGLEILSFGYPELKLADKGIVAFNIIKRELYFLSGYMFLDDFKKEFFLNQSFKNDSKVEYIKLKFFNYEPYDIKVKGDFIYFKSKVNMSNNAFNYRIMLKKNNENYIESKLELYMR